MFIGEEKQSKGNKLLFRKKIVTNNRIIRPQREGEGEGEGEYTYLLHLIYKVWLIRPIEVTLYHTLPILPHIEGGSRATLLSLTGSRATLLSLAGSGATLLSLAGGSRGTLLSFAGSAIAVHLHLSLSNRLQVAQ